MAALSNCLPAPGEEQSEFIEASQHLLRHGSSLALMALVAEALNGSEEFGDVDPEEDWKQWAERSKGFRLYYAALVDPTRDGAEAVSAARRGVGTHRRAAPMSTLVRFVSEACAAAGASSYVLALEDSCSYWMERGYLLETSTRMQARLNIFSDTYPSGSESDPEEDRENYPFGFAAAAQRLAKAVSLLEAAGGTWAAREAARALIIKAARNLETRPHEPKYRRLRKGNKHGALECFAELGFVDKGDYLEMEPQDAVGISERAREVIAALGAEETPREGFGIF